MLASGDNSSPALTKPDGVSTVPTMVRGDWVLFHPVYTPEELKAVEVSALLSTFENILIEFYRFYTEMRNRSTTSLHLTL